MAQDILKGRAEQLLALHRPGDPVVLPTVWDAWSTGLAADAGFAALTVGSHPVADSVGKADNEGMTFDDLLTRVAQITAATELPVSVDIESGYAEAPERLIEGLLSVGAVGLNIEDTVHSEGGRLRTPKNTPSWSGRCAQRPTRQACTSWSTRAPICSCARTATSPIGWTARSPGCAWPPTLEPTSSIRWDYTPRRP